MNRAQATKCLSSLLLFLLLLLAPIPARAQAVPTTVTVNRSVLLHLKNPARYVTVADKEIVEVPDPLKRNQLIINGKKIGATTMLVWEEGADKPTFFDVRVVGDREALEAQLRECAPSDRIGVDWGKDTLILSGNVANAITSRRAEEIGKAHAGKVLNHIRVDDPQQVLLQVKVAQVDKTSLKNLGISAIIKGRTAEGFSNLVGAPASVTTTSSSGGTTVTTSGLSGIAGSGPGLGSFDPLDPFSIGVSYFPAGVGAVLQALTTRGLAKILAEPNLLVKSGEVGNFLAGSRIPYSVVVSTGGTATTSIVFETVGVKLKFKPEVLENGLINLIIDPAEVSSIAGTLAVNGYPIIDTRDVRTSVELREGESLVLAGLLQEEQIKTMSKIPILGDIPVLGALFRSTHSDIREKDLVFFITPKIVKPSAAGTATELPTDRTPNPDEIGELDWMPRGR